MKNYKNVAFLIYDDITAMDFFGPFEVFSIANNQNSRALFNLYTVAVSPGPKLVRGQISINPEYDITNCPQPDILLIPGGYGARREMNNEGLLNWIKDVAAKAELVLTVCTGSLILAKTGLLKGMLVTTHHAGLELLKTLDPDISVIHKR
ncbi:MAG: DJ-1/PfpI family protein, partial [Pelosinus sp.]|nr:DJ-1/PfpI family protein [Pelosinus sp.]